MSKARETFVVTRSHGPPWDDQAPAVRHCIPTSSPESIVVRPSFAGARHRATSTAPPPGQHVLSRTNHVTTFGRFPAVFAAVLLGLAPQTTTAQSAACTPADVLRHVGALSSDSLAGRAPGSVGDRAARSYLSRTLASVGLAPGSAGYEQQVRKSEGSSAAATGCDTRPSRLTRCASR